MAREILSAEQAFEAYGKGNFRAAFPALTALADQGNVEALVPLAWMNETGAVGEADLSLARRLYQRAADAGSCDALYRLGRILKKSRNLPAVRAVFERGALQDHLPCISALGILLVETAENPDQAEQGMRWLTVAADRGHIFARRLMLLIKARNETSIRKVLGILAKIFWLKLEYVIERRKDAYSLKIL